MKTSRWLERNLSNLITIKMLAALILAPYAIVRIFFPPAMRMDALRSITNAEAFMFYWTEHGARFWVAVAMGAACGNYCLVFWWSPIIVYLQKLFHGQTDLSQNYKKLKLFMDEQSELRLLVKIKDFGEKAYYFFVPKLRDGYPRADDHHAYLPLLYYGCMPGGEWTGVCYAIEAELYLVIVAPVMILANTAKILIFGGLGVIFSDIFPVFHRYPLPLAIGILALPLFKRQTEEYLLKIRATPEDSIELPESEATETPSN